MPRSLCEQSSAPAAGISLEDRPICCGLEISTTGLRAGDLPAEISLDANGGVHAQRTLAAHHQGTVSIPRSGGLGLWPARGLGTRQRLQRSLDVEGAATARATLATGGPQSPGLRQEPSPGSAVGF